MGYLVNKEVKDSERATIASIFSFSSQMGIAVFTFLVGVFAEQQGLLFSYFICALAILVVPIIYIWVKDNK